MRQMINGRVVEVAVGNGGSVSSDAIRRAAGIASDRPLVLQQRDGSNRIINPGQNVMIQPNQYFTDVPKHDRGLG